MNGDITAFDRRNEVLKRLRWITTDESKRWESIKDYFQMERDAAARTLETAASMEAVRGAQEVIRLCDRVLGLDAVVTTVPR